MVLKITQILKILHQGLSYIIGLYLYLYRLFFCTLLDIVIFDSNTYSQLLEFNKPTGWLSRIWFWSIITPSITIIARRIKGMSQPIFYQGQFIDIATMIVILLIMLLVLAY